MERNTNNISSKELNIAKHWVKYELENRLLPTLPAHIDDRLFFEGRTAWNYRYSDLSIEQRDTSKRIAFSITATLKKKFHCFIEKHSFRFYSTCIYEPVTRRLEVTKITAIE